MPSTAPAAAAVRPVELGPGNPVDTFRWLREDDSPFIAVAAGAAGAYSSQRVVGLGVHAERTAAAHAAIGEVLERQSAYRLPRAPLSYATAAELPDAVVVPDVAATAGWWVHGTDPDAGATGSVPLEYAQFATPVREPLTAHRADSTGMAVHVRPDLALHAATAEVAERSLRRALLARPAAAAWAADGLPEPAAGWAAELRDRGCTVSLVPARSGQWWLCVALVGGRGPDGTGLVVGGSAAALDRTDAARRAVAEVFAKAEVRALRGSAGPAHPWATSPAVEQQRIADWLTWWGAATAPVIDAGADMPELSVPQAPHTLVLDRGDAYTDAVALHCRQVLCPGLPVDLPAALVAVGGTELFG